MVLFLAKGSQHHCCPEPGLLGRWPRACLLGRPPRTHTTTSPPTRRRQFQSPQLGCLPAATPLQLPGPGPSCLEGDRILAPSVLPSWSFPSGSLEGSGPVHLGSSPSRASLPTWTAGVPAAPGGSRSVLSARPGIVAASVPGCGPHPAGVSSTENLRISSGRAAWLSHFPCSVLEPCVSQLWCLRLCRRTTSILISILASHQPLDLPSMQQSTQHPPKCPVS